MKADQLTGALNNIDCLLYRLKNIQKELEETDNEYLEILGYKNTIEFIGKELVAMANKNLKF